MLIEYKKVSTGEYVYSTQLLNPIQFEQIRVVNEEEEYIPMNWRVYLVGDTNL